MVSPIRKYHIVSYKNASMYQKHQDTVVLHLSQVLRPSKKWEDYSGINKFTEEEIFSKSIEFEPVWIGTIVLDG